MQFHCNCVKGYSRDLLNKFKCIPDSGNHEFELVILDDNKLSFQIVHPDEMVRLH